MSPRRLVVITAAIVLVLLALLVALRLRGGGGAEHGTLPPSALPRAARGAAPCREDPLAGVHDSGRLRLLARCIQASGTVVEPHGANPQDGDVTFDLHPDPAFRGLLNAKNRAEGGLHIEIPPAYQPGCVRGQAISRPVAGLGVCTGTAVRLPPGGTQVHVVGAYVFDTNNDWYEIHPAWKVTRVR
jgi:hypothetical protein